MPEAEVLADLRWNPKNAANIFPSRCLGMFFWMESKTLLTCELLFRGVDKLHVVTCILMSPATHLRNWQYSPGFNPKGDHVH